MKGGILQANEAVEQQLLAVRQLHLQQGIRHRHRLQHRFGPQDPTDLSLDRALSPFDERHKVVMAGVLNSPWKQADSAGFQLSPVFQYHSGHPFNLMLAGEVNGNNHTTNERPIGANRDTGLGPSYVDFDMRLSWTHKLGEQGTLQTDGGRIQHRQPHELSPA